jgi:regulator of replication initiation timing
MPIESDIQDAITRNLPAAVGSVLRVRLDQADAMERKIEQQDKALADTKEHLRIALEANVRLQAQADKAKEILQREKDLLRAEQRSEVQSAVLSAEQKLVHSFLDRQKEIVLAVFANNRFKYQESRTDGHAFMPDATPSNQFPCPMTTSVPSVRTVEGEGDVPAIPPVK